MSLQQCYSECGSLAGSGSITWELLEMHLGVGPKNLDVFVPEDSEASPMILKC